MERVPSGNQTCERKSSFSCIEKLSHGFPIADPMVFPMAFPFKAPFPGHFCLRWRQLKRCWRKRNFPCHWDGIILDGLGYCHSYPHVNSPMNMMISPSKMVDAVGTWPMMIWLWFHIWFPSIEIGELKPRARTDLTIIYQAGWGQEPTKMAIQNEGWAEYWMSVAKSHHKSNGAG